MNLYETLYVIVPTLDDEATAGVVAKFSEIIAANGGEEVTVNAWGKRRLAYPINDLTEGYYVLINFSAPGTLPLELERNFKNDERILRYMVIRKDA